MNSRSTAAQAIDLRISQGTYLPPANSIPYGYLRNARTNSFEVDPETSRIVLRVFRLRSELYSAKENFEDVIDKLNLKESDKFLLTAGRK